MQRMQLFIDALQHLGSVSLQEVSIKIEKNGSVQRQRCLSNSLPLGHAASPIQAQMILAQNGNTGLDPPRIGVTHIRANLLREKGVGIVNAPNCHLASGHVFVAGNLGGCYLVGNLLNHHLLNLQIGLVDGKLTLPFTVQIKTAFLRRIRASLRGGTLVSMKQENQEHCKWNQSVRPSTHLSSLGRTIDHSDLLCLPEGAAQCGRPLAACCSITSSGCPVDRNL